MRLYRPVGAAELALIAASRFRAFPPRLPGQPIFYPVLNRDYAVSIARDWNVRDPASGYAGIVMAFDIDDDYVRRFEVRQVGAVQHRELWVPAEELEEFNSHIQRGIEVCDCFCGQQFTGAELTVSRERIQELVDRNRNDMLSADDEHELNQFLKVEHELRVG